MTWWDYKTGLPFQTEQDKPQPGSLDAESGVFCSTFDQTGTRLLLGGADKTIKVRRYVPGGLWGVRGADRDVSARRSTRSSREEEQEGPSLAESGSCGAVLRGGRVQVRMQCTLCQFRVAVVFVEEERDLERPEAPL